MQYYEGGHTIYGPNTRKYLSEMHGILLNNMIRSGSDGDLTPNVSYKMNAHSFYPKISISQLRLQECLSPVYQANTKQPYWSFQWKGLSPSQIQWHQSFIRIARKLGSSDWEPLLINSIPVDDQGYDIAIIMLDNNSADIRYEIRWYHPQTNVDTLYRFEILDSKNMPIFYSSVFTGN